MGDLSQTVLENDGEVLGIIPKIFFKNQNILINTQDHIITKNMHKRKMRMFKESKIIFVLPGGVGTLDEFFEVLTWAQLKIHEKKIILINYKNYWNQLLCLFNHMIENNFLSNDIFNYFKIVKNIDEAFNLVLKKNSLN